MKSSTKEFIYTSLSFLIPFIFIFSFTYDIQIHGDSVFHTIILKETIKTGFFPEVMPNFILDSDVNGTKPYPIRYSSFAYYLYSIFYLLGGITLLKFTSAIILSTSSLLFYKILSKEIKSSLALFATVFGIIIISLRFIMSPLLEHVLFLFFILGIYFFYKYIKSENKRYLIMFTLSISILASVKQQGIILMVLFLGIFVLLNLRNKKFISNILIISSIILLIVLPINLELIQRNGTIGYVPGNTVLPLEFPFSNFINYEVFKSKYPIDFDSNELNQNRLSYSLDSIDFKRTINNFFLYPVDFAHSYEGKSSNFLAFYIILFLIGIFTLYRKNKNLAIILGLLFLGEFIVTTIYKHYVHNYHIFGLFLACILMIIGITSFSKNKNYKIIPILIVIILIFNFTVIYPETYYKKFWKNSGKISPELENEYLSLCKYLNTKNISENTIFLTSSHYFRYYCDRPQFWINEGGGKNIQSIMNSNNISESIKFLELYNIQYIMIEKKQIYRRGLYDYISSKGIIVRYNNSNRINKIFESKELLLLKLEINLNKTLTLSKT